MGRSIRASIPLLIMCYSMAVQGDGKVLLRGLLHLTAALPCANERRWVLDSSFNPPTLNNGINSVAVQADGKVLLGGYFTSPGNNIARLSTDGVPDTRFQIHRRITVSIA